MAKVCCSIELEPKTLNQGQLHQAREVAADVVQKLEPSEASAVFIDGPRSPLMTMEAEKSRIEEEGQEEYTEEWRENIMNYEGKRCQCSCTVSTAITESPEQLLQPLSAPF